MAGLPGGLLCAQGGAPRRLLLDSVAGLCDPPAFRGCASGVCFPATLVKAADYEAIHGAHNEPIQDAVGTITPEADKRGWKSAGMGYISHATGCCCNL